MIYNTNPNAVLLQYQSTGSYSHLNAFPVKAEVSVQSDTHLQHGQFHNEFPINKINDTSTRQRNANFNSPNS